jgi:hypothetical protein
MTDTLQTVARGQLHIRYNGESIDVPLADLDIGDISTEQQIRSAAAEHLGFPVSKLAAYQVDRNTETGDVTLRPQAIFG